MALPQKRLDLMLDDIADYIEKYGLQKETYFKGVSLGSGPPVDLAFQFVGDGETPKCCTLGAIYMRTAQEDQDHRLWTDRVFAALRQHAGLDCYDIPNWNDAKHRRKADVVKMFRKVAEKVRTEKGYTK